MFTMMTLFAAERGTIAPMRVVGILCIVSSVWGATPDQIRNAAAKGVAMIQQGQKNWFTRQTCYSCHQQSLPSIAFRAAREHGIPVNEDLAHADAVKAYSLLADIDRGAQFTHIIDPSMSEGYMLLGADAAGVRPNPVAALYARLIALRQKPDGHWDTIDVRPPQAFSAVTATSVSIRVLQIYTHPSLAADAKARIARARVWLAARQVSTTEERTAQMLGLSAAGADRASLAKLAAALQASQRTDGGWAAHSGRPSDAFATGEALVALAEAGGVPPADPAWQRGIDYLLRTQAADGSWHVVSRVEPPAPVSPPYFESGYPYGHDQFVSSMGATWAVRALAAALGPAKKIQQPELREAVPTLDAWMEPAMFGSAADLKNLLDHGLDPNAATKNGTTLLMLAQPDLEKTKLLVARGARINARSKTRYSALLVAAQYPGSSPAMNYLLDHGAEVKLPKGAGTPLFNASPYVAAAFAGNSDMLIRLYRSGDNPDSFMMMLGMFPTSGLLSAVFSHNAEAALAALDASANPDLPDQDGITPLGWAAIGCEANIARMLIARGADVNHVDKNGMTPLLYAASIDFGDSSMVDLLLKSGANPEAKDKDGLTAAQLAKKYGHTQFAAWR
jgi:ankyrin repeat protein